MEGDRGVLSTAQRGYFTAVIFMRL